MQPVSQRDIIGFGARQRNAGLLPAAPFDGPTTELEYEPSIGLSIRDFTSPISVNEGVHQFL